MTKQDMYNAILNKYSETLRDTIDKEKRISIAFTNWFQGMLLEIPNNNDGLQVPGEAKPQGKPPAEQPVVGGSDK